MYFVPLIKKAIQEYVNNNPEDQILLKFNITREFVKKPVMAIPYSISIFGLKEHLIL